MGEKWRRRRRKRNTEEEGVADPFSFFPGRRSQIDLPPPPSPAVKKEREKRLAWRCLLIPPPIYPTPPLLPLLMTLITVFLSLPSGRMLYYGSCQGARKAPQTEL